MTNKRYFFTYGSEGQDFVGGWTSVLAPNREAACIIFRLFHPDKHEGILNCSSVYNEEEFLKTRMSKSGNLGSFTHEVLTISRCLIGGND